MSKYAFGVDIGGTAVKIGLFNMDGELLDKWQIDTEITEDERSILRDINSFIEGVLKDKDISRDQIVGMGLGVPGPILEDGTVNRCVNLNWGRFNIEKTMEDICGFTVKAGNDANVAALGEQWKGGGQGYDSVVLFTLGTGVGGGVVLDGEIVKGVNGSAGEVGHFRAYEDETEDACGCGNYGCLEQYVSAKGITKLARRFMKLNNIDVKDTIFKDEEALTSINIFREARAGDDLALGIVNEMFRLLGKAMATISCVIDPQAFVVGGGVSNEGEYLSDGIKKAYDDYAFHATMDTEIVLAQLGNDAGMYGAVRLILEDI